MGYVLSRYRARTAGTADGAGVKQPQLCLVAAEARRNLVVPTANFDEVGQGDVDADHSTTGDLPATSQIERAQLVSIIGAGDDAKAGIAHERVGDELEALGSRRSELGMEFPAKVGVRWV